VDEASEADARSTQGPVWIKSSFSFANSNCVETARLPDGCIGVRDSKNPHGGMLRLTPAEWGAFLDGVRNGEFEVVGHCG
jgi:hypothetical protein